MKSYLSFNKSIRYEVGSVYPDQHGYYVIKTAKGTILYSHYVLRKYLRHIREPFFVKFLDDNLTNFDISNLVIIAKDHSKRWVVRDNQLILQTISGGKLWSRKYDACIVCKSTDFNHTAKGYCTSCYMMKYNIDNAKRKPSIKQKNKSLKDLLT